MRVVAIVLAVVFFVLGILYGTGYDKLFHGIGCRALAPRHAFGRHVGLSAALLDLGAFSERAEAMTR